MWDQSEEVIQAELGQGERLVWAGRPPQGLKLRAGDAFIIPFSLLWGGFAIFWEIAGILSEELIVVLFGIPFVLLGLYLIIGRFFVEARQRLKTFYGVTSERIIIVSGLFSRKVQSLCLDTLTDVSLTERRHGKGVITFGPVHPMNWMYSGYGPQGMGIYGVPAFELAADARQVYEVIRNAQRAAKHQAALG